MSKESKRRLKGDGTIRLRKDGRWEGRIPVGRDKLKKKTLYKSFYGKTLAEVRARIKRFKNDTPQERCSTEMTLGEWLDKWLLLYKQTAVAPSTYNSYSTIIKWHLKPTLGNFQLHELTTDDIQKAFNTFAIGGSRKDGLPGSLSVSSIVKIKVVLNAALNQAIRNRIILFNPIDGVVLPRQRKKEISVLTMEDQTSLLNAFEGHRLRALYVTALATGMRRGELLALIWRDIDFDNMTISVTKSASRMKNHVTGDTEIVIGYTKTINGNREIPIIASLLPLLKEHQLFQEKERKLNGKKYNKRNLVFCSTTGTLIEPRRLNTTLWKTMKKAGISPVSFHSLRHTFATRALEHGIPAKVVQEILGHSDVALTLNLYTHVLDSTVKSEMAKLNDLFEAKNNPSEPKKDEVR